MRNEKRTLFPSGGKELDLYQPRVRRASSLLYIPNHLSFKGMFMFAHFSPPIAPNKAELMRMLSVKDLCILQCPFFLSLCRHGGTVSASYLSHAHF